MIFTEEGNEYMQKFNDATMNMEYSEFSAKKISQTYEYKTYYLKDYHNLNLYNYNVKLFIFIICKYDHIKINVVSNYFS